MHSRLKNKHTYGMKKLLYFAVTVLSLGVIFGAGWAAGTGRMPTHETPAAVKAEETEYETRDGGCPEYPGTDGDDCGTRPIFPHPPVFRGKIIRIH